MGVLLSKSNSPSLAAIDIHDNGGVFAGLHVELRSPKITPRDSKPAERGVICYLGGAGIDGSVL